jgi:hypothetical protein
VVYDKCNRLGRGVSQVSQLSLTCRHQVHTFR